MGTKYINNTGVVGNKFTVGEAVIGEHAVHTGYYGLWNTDAIVGSTSQYMIISAGTDTFVNGDNVYIRAGNNSSTNQVKLSTSTGLTVGGNRVLTVADEGSGNGLDADTLDGNHASAFLTSYTETDTLATVTGRGASTTTQLFFDAGFDSHPIMLSGAQTFNDIDRSGFYNLYNTHNSSTNSPGFHYGTMIAIGNDKGGQGFGLQIAHERTGAGMYVRGMNDNNTWYDWDEIWTSGTDGSGSGLDADTVDGFHVDANAGGLVKSYQDVTTTFHSGVSGYRSSMGMVYASDGPNSGSDWYRFIQPSYREGSGGTNVWQTQLAFYGTGGDFWLRQREGGNHGSSGWGSWHRVWTSNSDGPGSGLDADTVDGQHLGTSAAVAFDHLNLGGATGDNGEDLKVGGIRGRFSNEHIQLYNKVGIGYPSGWDGDNSATPTGGLAVYGGTALAYNNGGVSIGQAYSSGDHSNTKLEVNGDVSLRAGSDLYFGQTTTLNSWKTKITSNNTSTMTINAQGLDVNNGGYASPAVVWLKANNTELSHKGNTIWHAGNDGASSGLDADTLDGLHLSNIDNAEGYKTWAVSASGAQTVRHHIARLYGTPAHWDANWQNIELQITAEYFEATTLKFRLTGNYGSGEANMMRLHLLDATGDLVNNIRLVLGSATDAGWDYSGQNVYYMDLYADVRYYSQFKIHAKTFGHGYGTTNPTSGGYHTIFYASPSTSNISDFSINHIDPIFRGHKIWHAGNDGSGSTLDADLLDGNHASAFATSGHNHDTRYLRKDVETEGTQLNLGGEISAGSGAKLQVQGFMRTGPIMIAAGNTSTSTFDTTSEKWLMNSSGNLYIGDGTNYSDRIFHDSYHPNADQWTTARTITLSGDLNGSVSLDGSADVTLSAQVVNNSHTHDDRYYTESEMQTFFKRGYIEKVEATNLAVGWYTIATNTGDRALGEFQIWDTASSDHQSVLFNASHHFGTNGSNDITVLANSRYSGTNFRYIRIKENATYDGAALQVYIDATSNNVKAAIVGGNAQESGWVLKDWVADGTDPGDVTGWSNFAERCKVDLDVIVNGGIMLTGHAYTGGDTTQYRVLNTSDEGSGNGLDADTVDGIQGASLLRSDAQDAYTPKRIDFGSSSNWDAVGFTNMTNLHVQGHNYFWFGAGNGTWFEGTANTKSSTSGLAADATGAHDTLITVMYGTAAYDRGITFGVDNTGAGNDGWRLGKWHASNSQASSKLTVDGGLHVRGGQMANYDYYADDYSTYWDNQAGGAYWPGDSGWIDPSITAGHAIQIQAGNAATNSNNPALQFHQYGYGGVQFRYDGPNDRMFLESTGSDRMDWFRNKTDHGYIELGPANTSWAHIYTDRPGFYFNKTTFQLLGNQVWHEGNDGSGSGLDADKLDGQQNTQFLRKLSSGSESNIDTYTDNGLRSLSYTGHSRHLMSFNLGGSPGTTQQEWHYNGQYRFRNKVDNNNWSDWRYVVSTTTNQDELSGTVWHSGNDGAGTGLNADLVDGIHGTSLLRSDASDTYSGGTLTIDGPLNMANTRQISFERGSGDYSTRIYATNNPPAGYTSTSQNYWMAVESKGGMHVIVNTDGSYNSGENAYDHFTIWQDNISNYNARQFYVTNVGNVYAKGDVTAFQANNMSDIRLKKDVKPIENALDIVDKLNGVTFTWKRDDKKSLGFIAQDVEKVVPELVEDKPAIDDPDTLHKTVNYANMVAILTEAVKELKEEIDQLKKQIK